MYYCSYYILLLLSLNHQTGGGVIVFIVIVAKRVLTIGSVDSFPSRIVTLRVPPQQSKPKTQATAELLILRNSTGLVGTVVQ